MTEILVRLSEMREAAERLRRGSERMVQSAQDISDNLSYLQIQGIDSYSLQIALKYRPANLDTELKRFAENLDQVANEVEIYLNTRLAADEGLPKVWFVGAAAMLGGASARIRNDDDEPEEHSPDYNLRDYMGTANRSLYNTLSQKEQQLFKEQESLDALLRSRERMATDLQALKDRLRSVDPTVNFNNVPRIQMMEQQLAQTQQQIKDAETSIHNLTQDIQDLQTRLERVKPGAGADLNLIAKLEHSTTSEFIKANTFDCVKHVVGKFAVPDVIARDAYLWDDAALKHPEYGITVGDTPLKGSVLVMEREHTYADDLAGHVMYVEHVTNGEVWVTDNMHSQPVKLSDLTDELTGSNIKYLYFPWNTHA